MSPRKIQDSLPSPDCGGCAYEKPDFWRKLTRTRRALRKYLIPFFTLNLRAVDARLRIAMVYDCCTDLIADIIVTTVVGR